MHYNHLPKPFEFYVNAFMKHVIVIVCSTLLLAVYLFSLLVLGIDPRPRAH